jgi:hypothetical protein
MIMTKETINSNPGPSQWRLASVTVPFTILGTGIFATLYPSFSKTVLGFLVITTALLVIWAFNLSLTTKWQEYKNRQLFSIFVLESFSVFGIILAWRVNGENIITGSAMTAGFLITMLIGLIFRNKLSKIFAFNRDSQAVKTFGLSAVTLSLTILLIIRIDPLWFAHWLLFPTMLLITLIAISGTSGKLFR